MKNFACPYIFDQLDRQLKESIEFWAHGEVDQCSPIRQGPLGRSLACQVRSASLKRPSRSLWQSGLAIAGGEMFARGSIADRLCRNPVADGESRKVGHVECCLMASFVHAPELRQACCQNAPGSGAIGRLLAQRF